MKQGFHPRFTITNRLTEALTRIERARGFLEAATLSEDWIREMGERALVLEAHHTTHIEGTQLTLDQAERLLAGESVPEADPDDVRELLNYRRAFDFVSEFLSSGLPAAQGTAQAGAPITEGLIREIHKRLVEGVRGGAAAPGEYRKIQNYVVNSATGETIYTPPPAHEVPILMAELVEWLNRERETHPVLVSGIAQFQLVHIHPFLDGNGRTSRLLSTLCLYRAGYDFKRLFTISEYYDRDRAALPGTGPDAHSRTREHQHPGVRGALPGGQPAHASTGAEEHGGERGSRYRRGDQSADIPHQGIGGRTCDKLATQLATSGARRTGGNPHQRPCLPAGFPPPRGCAAL